MAETGTLPGFGQAPAHSRWTVGLVARIMGGRTNHPTIPAERSRNMAIGSLRLCSLLLPLALAVAAHAMPQPALDRAALADRLVEASRPLREAGVDAPQRLRWQGQRAPASLEALVIMVDFADSCFYGRQDEFAGPLPTSTQRSFYYAAHDSVYYAHLLQDVADYYDSASGGRFALNVAVHGRIIGLPETMAFYGNHPEFGERAVQLAADAIAAFDDEIDFARYDSVILIHAGAGQETDVLNNSPEQIYSTYLGPEAFARAAADSVIDTPYIPTDDFPAGQGVRHVLILPETQFQDPYEGFSGQFGSLGTYCFVVGLRLGMLSLSDFTPAGAPDSQGIGQFCLMGYGLFNAGGYVPPHPCAFNKQFMGWLEPFLVDPTAGDTWTLHPSGDPSHPLAAARVDVTGAEYFLLEYRLQDPDGNRIFSFAGDLNGNNVPDFYDASNAAGGGTPTRFFVPATDTRERFVGAEWDFFLTDNPARAPGVKGAGSGILIWHIDEGVVRDAFGQRQNLFNADPRRKAVDLEEADGIEDLDSRQPSPYWLGGDDDAFRGEGNVTFGPDTRPDTRTNGGLRTGLVIDQISNVVVDSLHVFHAGTDSMYVGILYAETMTFRCRREPASAEGPALLASRDLRGVDMTGSHLLAAPLDGNLAGGESVFVAAADSGRVYAWTADLSEWIDHDADPLTFAPLAIATGADGEPVAWLPPAAAGRFDPEAAGLVIVLTSPQGLYAFHQDGAPLATEPDGSARGRVAELAAHTAPLLVPDEPGEGLAIPVVAAVVVGGNERDATGSSLRFIDHLGEDVVPPVALPGRGCATPVRADRRLYVPLELGGEVGALVAVDWPIGGEASVAWQATLDLVPGAQPPLVAPPLVMVVGADGRGQTVVDRGVAADVEALWPAALLIEGALGAGGAYTGGDALGRLGGGGAALDGWPRRPRPAIRASGAQPLALGGGTGKAGASPAHFLFGTRDGRIYATTAAGEVVPGWPLAGPADLQATPVAVTLDAGDPAQRLLLMAAATTPEIVGLGDGDDDDGRNALMTRPTTRLRSWLWPAAGPAWRVPEPGAMHGGSPWRGEAVAPFAESTPGAALSASHLCYPQPLTEGLLRVRATVARDGHARAVILNLQGQRVRDTGPVAVLGGSPFELEIDMDGVASGLYVCRLEANGQTSVRTIAVAR